MLGWHGGREMDPSPGAPASGGPRIASGQSMSPASTTVPVSAEGVWMTFASQVPVTNPCTVFEPDQVPDHVPERSTNWSGGGGGAGNVPLPPHAEITASATMAAPDRRTSPEP